MLIHELIEKIVCSGNPGVDEGAKQYAGRHRIIVEASPIMADSMESRIAGIKDNLNRTNFTFVFFERAKNTPGEERAVLRMLLEHPNPFLFTRFTLSDWPMRLESKDYSVEQAVHLALSVSSLFKRIAERHGKVVIGVAGVGHCEPSYVTDVLKLAIDGQQRDDE
jgi:hypothetical protein